MNIWKSYYAKRNHGYTVFRTLFLAEMLKKRRHHVFCFSFYYTNPSFNFKTKDCIVCVLKTAICACVYLFKSIKMSMSYYVKRNTDNNVGNFLGKKTG